MPWEKVLCTSFGILLLYVVFAAHLSVYLRFVREKSAIKRAYFVAVRMKVVFIERIL